MDVTPLRLSLQVALVSTLLSMAAGLPLAWWLSRRRAQTRAVLSSLVLVPMLLPPTVLGYYLLAAVGRDSPLGGALDRLFGFTLVFHWSGAVLAAFVVSAPFLVRAAQAGFEGVDRLHEEAAAVAGASPLSIFLRISVPLAWPAIAAGIAMSLARALGEFGATLMVAGSVPGRTQTLSIAIYEAVQAGRMDDAQAMALTLAAVTMGLLLAVSSLGGARWWRR
ncbi:MAG: molybdate ABC transporter permease subunit [SAR202 cluster bacterium]|nr:molybdate ABC transporter permease subunit [SAR202 cluster bacterium]